MTSISTGAAQKITAKWGEDYAPKKVVLGTLVGMQNDKLYFSYLISIKLGKRVSF